MATPLVTIRVGGIYMAGIRYPLKISGPSPPRPIPPSDGLRIVDAPRERSNLQTERRHYCVVLHYDAATQIAVVFLGTAHPEVAHRFVPWQNTPRRDHQPADFLVPSVPDFFIARQGFINFTHCVRVRVLNAATPPPPPPPGGAEFLDPRLDRSNPATIQITISEEEIEKLKALHRNYWAGGRYTLGGEPQGPGGGGGGGAPQGPGGGGGSSSGAERASQGPGGGAASSGAEGGVPSGEAGGVPSGGAGASGGEDNGRWGTGLIVGQIKVFDSTYWVDSSGATISPQTMEKVSWLAARIADQEDERVRQVQLLESIDSGSDEVEAPLPPFGCVLEEFSKGNIAERVDDLNWAVLSSQAIGVEATSVV